MKNEFSQTSPKKLLSLKISRINKKIRVLAYNTSFLKFYPIFCAALLLISVTTWTLLSAKYNLTNADHLVNAQLLHDFKTFNESILPGAHTFLIKWPIFLGIKLAGTTSFAYYAATYFTVLTTITALCYLIYRIDKRPIVFGTIWLALASILVMVPIAPYSGALLPVNMAMIATRNLEYVVFIGSIAALLKNRSVKSPWFWLAASLMALVIASDKLFLVFAFGSAILGLLFYAKLANWRFVAVNIDWLTSNVIAAFISFGLLAVIGAGILNIAGENTTSPYHFVGSVKDIALGVFYGATGIMSNYGANPGYDTTLLSKYPITFLKNLFSLALVPYLVNGLLLIVSAVALVRLLITSTNQKKSQLLIKKRYPAMAILLAGSSLTALISFIFTDHYYAVDARYLGIIFYTLIIGLTAYASTLKKVDNAKIFIAAIPITASIIFGTISFITNFDSQYSGVKAVQTRSEQIAQILSNHKVDALVGDYWRVVPAMQASGNSINPVPLSDCSNPRQVLTSKNWQKDLNHHSFAYLLNLDGGNLTDFPNCTLKQVISNYGNPNSTVLVNGTLSHPKEYLLFYDNGINNASKKSALNSENDPLQPVNVDELPNTTCSGPSTMNIVAHQDDDLLFMNPDLIRVIRNGECVRTVYITAGDSGSSKYYYLSRQKGAQAAYSQMLGISNEWTEKVVKLTNNEYVTIAQPKANKKVSLVFLNLPDGNLFGQGFSTSNNESLKKLAEGKINLMISLDGQSSYSSDQLTETLVQLMSLYQPSTIRTQASDVGSIYHDHSDHETVGKYVKSAYSQYEKQQFDNKIQIPILYYIGYPTHELDPNVEGEDLAYKQAAFLAYAQYDGSVCTTLEQCLQTPTYGSYLSRQYLNPE